MGYTEKKHGTEIALHAQPDTLHGQTGASGALTIECKNHSMVQLTLQILSLSSDNPTVALPQLGNPGPKFNAPRRPNKRSAKVPSISSAVVGTWVAGVPGPATIDARVEVLAPPGMFFFDATPTTDVKVT